MAEGVVSSAGDCSFAPVTPAKGIPDESRVGKKILVESYCLAGDGGGGSGIGGVVTSLSGENNVERLGVAPVTPAKGIPNESHVVQKILVESSCLSVDGGAGGGIGGVVTSFSSGTNEDRVGAEPARPFLVQTEGRFPGVDDGSVFPENCQEGTDGGSSCASNSSAGEVRYCQDGKQEGWSAPFAPSTPFEKSEDFNLSKVGLVISEKRKKTPKKKKHKPKVVIEGGCKKARRRRLVFDEVNNLQDAKPISPNQDDNVCSKNGGCNDEKETNLTGPLNEEEKIVENRCLGVCLGTGSKSTTRSQKRVRRSKCLVLSRKIAPIFPRKFKRRRTDNKRRKELLTKVYFTGQASPSWVYKWIVHRSRCLVLSRILAPNFPRHLKRTRGSIKQSPPQQPCEQGDVKQSFDGTIVPYDVTKGDIKKKIARPEILLDEVSLRMWKQLALCDGSIDSGKLGDDMESKWHKERELFKGRVHSFIARMHQFLGNRCFKPWGGSVIDSVVGVFLTQNVADYLSSSAFMSLVAKFPIQSTSSDKEDIEMTCGEDDGESSLKMGSSFSDHQGDTIGTQESKTDCETKTDITDSNSSEERLCSSECTTRDEANKTSGNVESTIEYPATPVKRETVIRRGKKEKQNTDLMEWKRLRQIYSVIGPRPFRQMDSAAWEKVQRANYSDVAKCIKARGQHNVLAVRIQDFLDRVVEIGGDLDLEWLRHCPPEKAKQFLLEIDGLGPKSVECVQLLELQHIAFPVDTHVCRIAVRLGWVPLQPLPGNLQIHLLEEYPVLDHIQKYLWPRLRTLDQKTLYELHYQLITFGKVFCTKKKPNCSACPMKGECKHYASAYSSAKLALPAPTNDDAGIITVPTNVDEILGIGWKPEPLSAFEGNDQVVEVKAHKGTCEPIIEEPPSPDRANSELPVSDIEDCYGDDSREMIILDLTGESTSTSISPSSPWNAEFAPSDSRALVPVTPEFASIPQPKLKLKVGLRTEHCVYELPDSHPLVRELDVRDAEDPSPYLLLIWTPDDVRNMPISRSRSPKSVSLAETCTDNSFSEGCDFDSLLGTILIPCRTAMRARFPLNGTYFQVNEVFADHKSTRNPITVPRYWIWNLPRRIAYFGSNTTSILRGLSAEKIQECFWQGFICGRGFDRRTRTPIPLSPRFHLPKHKKDKEDDVQA